LNYQNKEQNEKKHNYFYKITNLINGKFYYGVHSTNKEKYDYYMGGGRLITAAIKKHGKKNFKKEIIADYPTRKEASDHEKLIVTMDLVLDENCYNLRTGGDAEYLVTDEHRINIGNSSRGRYWSEEIKEKKRLWALGRSHSDETKQHISNLRKGSKNGMFGRTFYEIWIEKYGKEIADIKLEEHKQKNRNKVPNCAKKCNINNEIFESMASAARKYNISVDVVKGRLKSEKYLTWNFIKF